MFCFNCGKEVQDHWKFCKFCGAELIESADMPDRSKVYQSGKKYEIPKSIHYDKPQKWEEKGEEIRDRSELSCRAEDGKSLEGYYCDLFVILEDGTTVGFVYGHCKKYEGAKNYKYNLYRVDPDGTATFLNDGSIGGIEDMYVQDGEAFWSWDGINHRVKIF